MRIFLTGAASLVGAEVLRALMARHDVEVGLAESRDIDRLQAYVGASLPAVSDGPFDVVIDCSAPDPSPRPAGRGWRAAPGEGRSLQDGAPHPPLTRHLLPASGAKALRRPPGAPHPPLRGTFSPQAGRRPSMIELLERNPALRLVYLSTAFVGGTRRGLFTEFDLDLGQRFHNAWERGMFEAETRLRASGVSDRITIVRASHTLGCAATGNAFDLGGAYPLLSALASASLLPGDPRARLDFVPADYVAAATVALAISGAAGTFHLASGWDASIPVRHAAALAAQTRGRRRGAFLLPRVLAWPLRTPYLYQGPVFDTFLAERALGIEPPRVESWLAGMLDKISNLSDNSFHHGTEKKPAASAAFRL